MTSFEYFSVDTLDKGISILAGKQGKAKVFAGGTNLLVDIKQGAANPQCLVDIKSIPGLDSVRYQANEGLKVGALTTIRTIETSTVIKNKFTILSQAAHKIGSAQIRNRATIGGNLCDASPSADTAPALICLGASVKTQGSGGERSMLLEDFFTGPGETILQPDEILTQIQIPPVPPYSAGVYLKLGRMKTMDLATVGVAVLLTAEATDGVCDDIKITLGAVAPTPKRAKSAEGVIRKKKMVDDLMRQTAHKASQEARPISDVRASADYRREMVEVLTYRALCQARELIRPV
jgi:carbon-monoxide dehydrogenase medium subunit